MPLHHQKEVGKSGKLGIWHITERLQDLLKMQHFSEEELLLLNSFAYENRKKEWLVSRILAGQLAGKKNIQIVYDKYNKPYLKDSKHPISLSHSHGLLTVILDETETGIDIEIIKPKIINIKEKFMNKSELESLQKENMVEQLTLHWCAKEALYKLYGKKELGFKEHLSIEPFQYSETGIIKGWIKNAAVNSRFTLQYENLILGSDTYMLAYVIGKD